MAPSTSTSLRSSPLSSSSTNSVLPALHHASSGSIGTLLSTCALYPLSLVIARLQVQRQLRRRRQGRRSRPRSHPQFHPNPQDERADCIDRTTESKSKTHTVTGTTASIPDPASEPRKNEEEDPQAVAGRGHSARDPRYSPPTHPAHTSRLPHNEQDRHLHSQNEGVDTQGQQRQQTTPTTSLPEDKQSRRPKRQTAGDQEEKEEERDYAGIVDAFSRIWNSSGGGGLRAFYTGLAQDAPKSVLDSFLFFLFYEWFRALRLRSSRHRGRSKASGSSRGLGVAEELAVGVVAGACSRAFTTPIANIVTRKQTATLLDNDPNNTGTSTSTTSDIARSIYHEKGLAGFWSGYSASLVLTLNPSLTFFLQEFLKATFAEKAYDDPGPRLTFLFAATSKAVSSFVTYPFQIAKTRLQAGIPLDDDDDDQEDDTEKQSDRPTVNATADPKEREHDGDRNGENETAPTPIRAVKTLAQRSVFGTVAHIIRTEGIQSLYDGVGAELLKGFFSHGTTMLAKDIVHKFLFKMYIFTLGLLTELRQRRRRQQQQQRGGQRAGYRNEEIIVAPMIMLRRVYFEFVGRGLRGVSST